MRTEDFDRIERALARLASETSPLAGPVPNADEIWKLAAGELDDAQRDDLQRRIAQSPAAVEELRRATQAFAAAADDGSATAQERSATVDLALERIHGPSRATSRRRRPLAAAALTMAAAAMVLAVVLSRGWSAPTWEMIEVLEDPVRGHATALRAVEMRMQITPKAPSHVVLLVARRDAGAVLVDLVFPPAEPDTALRGWPVNPLPAGSTVLLPPRGEDPFRVQLQGGGAVFLLASRTPPPAQKVEDWRATLARQLTTLGPEDCARAASALRALVDAVEWRPL